MFEDANQYYQPIGNDFTLGNSFADSTYSPSDWNNFTAKNFAQDFSLGVPGIDGRATRPSSFELGNPSGPSALGFRNDAGDIVDINGNRINSSTFGDEFSNRFTLPSLDLKGLDAKGIAKKIAEALASLGQGSKNAAGMPFGMPQGVRGAGAPRAMDFNGPSFAGKIESPIDFASKGSAEFNRFLSFLTKIAPLLYGDQGQRLTGRA